MKRTFEEALEHRRSYYSIGSSSPVSDEELIRVVRQGCENTFPSAFNSQSTRIVLLFGRRALKKHLGYRERYLESAYSGRGFCQDGG